MVRMKFTPPGNSGANPLTRVCCESVNTGRICSPSEALREMATNESSNVVEETEAAKREAVLLEEIMMLRSQIAEYKKMKETTKEEAQQLPMKDFTKTGAGIYQAGLTTFMTTLKMTVHGFMANVQDFKTNVLDLNKISTAPNICTLCDKPIIKPNKTVDGLQDCLIKLRELTDLVKSRLTPATKHLKHEQEKVDRFRDEAHKCFMDIIRGKKHSYTIEYESPVISFHIQPHPMYTHLDQQPKKKLRSLPALETEETSTLANDPTTAASISASDDSAL